MKKPFAIILALIVAAGLVLVIVNATSNHHHRSSSTPTRTASGQNESRPSPRPAATATRPANATPAPTSTPRPRASGTTNAAEMSTIQLEQPGTVEQPGASVTLPLATADNDIAYATVIVDAPHRVGAGPDAVYSMRVTIRLLVTLHQHPAGVSLNHSNLADFTILNHPGAEPLTPTSTTTPGCAPLPAAPPAMNPGDTLIWCVTAAAATGTLPAAGGQYATPTGPYESPITWLADTTADIP